MSSLTPVNRDLGRAGHPTQFAPHERLEADAALSVPIDVTPISIIGATHGRVRVELEDLDETTAGVGSLRLYVYAGDHEDDMIPIAGASRCTRITPDADKETVRGWLQRAAARLSEHDGDQENLEQAARSIARDAEGLTNGTIGDALTVGLNEDFDATYSVTGRPAHKSYDGALAAADGDAGRVWMRVEGDYHRGEKEFKFDFDGDEEEFTSETAAEAYEMAASAFNGRYGDEIDDEDYTRTEEYTAADAEGWLRAVTVDDPDSLNDGEPAGNTYLRAPDQRLDPVSFVVTDVPRERETEIYEY